MKDIYYFDHAATTPVDREVLAAMIPFFSDKFGNPGGLYSLGFEAKEAITVARKQVADFLRAQENEIVFTPGGTASINLAIKGLMEALRKREDSFGHIVTTAIEHHAVLDTVEALADKGFSASIIPVDEMGIVLLEQLKKSIKPETRLVSVMTANNEIGTLQPIKEIGVYLEELNQTRTEQGLGKVYFHTDACQASGSLDLNVDEFKVDLLTINGSKIYGPKGIGALYVRKGTPLASLVNGGGQEQGLFSGTENVSAIVGLAKAVELAKQNRVEETQRLRELRDYLVGQLKAKLTKIRFNGDLAKRLPGNVNVSILDAEGEAMLLHLDELGIAAATGSACTSDTLEPSYVIRALGLPYEVAHGSMRFTLGKLNDKSDIDYLMQHLPAIVENLRKISPVNVSLDSVERTVQKTKREVLELKPKVN